MTRERGYYAPETRCDQEIVDWRDEWVTLWKHGVSSVSVSMKSAAAGRSPAQQINSASALIFSSQESYSLASGVARNQTYR